MFEKYLRKAAYQMVSLKDGYYGLITHKRDFRKFVSEKIEVIQAQSFEKLKGILNHAFKTCPYYHELWKRIGFEPGKLEGPEAFPTLPFLTKDIIETSKKDIISRDFNANELELSYTGGTSGTHSSFYRDRRCTAMRMGRQWGILELCSYSLGDRCGLIWGVQEDLSHSSTAINLKRKFRKFATAQETLCCAILDPQKMSDFYARLSAFKPTVLYGYPNAMAHFAAFIKDNGLPPIRVKTIICTAERLSEGKRRLLSEVFHGQVFNLYCTREHGCIGFECPKHDGFHVDVGSVHVEIISNGYPAKPGETGQIVVTDLLNYGMPFIRYKIGDIGRFSDKPCNCGCNLPILSRLEGRETDLVYGPDGSAVTVMDAFMDEPDIDAMQVVQQSLNEVDLLLVVRNSYSKETERRAIDVMRQCLGREIKINVRIVPEIPRNPISGKFEEVISKIPRPSKFTHTA